MKRWEAELRGRLMVMEALTTATIAHTARLTTQPHLFIRALMLNAEACLGELTASDDKDQQLAAVAARESFRRISDALLAHIVEIGPHSGEA